MNFIVSGFFVALFFLADNLNCLGHNSKWENKYESLRISQLSIGNAVFRTIGDTAIKSEENLIMEKIYKLPEVRERDHFIDSMTNHKHGISMIILQRPNKSNPYYIVQVGYNNEIRFETNFTFYVYKKNDAIKFYDTESGKVITLNEWRNKHN